MQNGAKIHVMYSIFSPLGEHVSQLSGFSQGDALSGDLFNLGLLPLILILNHRNNIQRYKMKWYNNRYLQHSGAYPAGSSFTYSDDCISMLASDNNYI